MSSAVAAWRPSAVRTRLHRRKRMGLIVLYAITIIVLIVIAFPIYWLITTSFKYPNDTATYPPVIIPTRVTFENYRSAFSTPGVGRACFNSVFISLMSTLLTTLLGSLA